MALNFEPSPVNRDAIQVQLDGRAPADINTIKDNVAANPLVEANKGGLGGERIDTGAGPSVAQSGGMPHLGDLGKGHNVPPGDSPILPKPDQFVQGRGGTARRRQRQTTDDPTDAQGKKQPASTGRAQSAAATTRSANVQESRTSALPASDPSSSTAAAAASSGIGAQNKVNFIEDFVGDLNLSPEIKDELIESALNQMHNVDSQGDQGSLLDSLSQIGDAAQEATGVLRGSQQNLLNVQAQVQNGTLDLSDAKAQVAMITRDVQGQLANASDSDLKAALKGLTDDLQHFSAALEARAPVVTVLKEQYAAFQREDLSLQEMEANIRGSGLNHEQEEAAVLALRSWKGQPWIRGGL